MDSDIALEIFNGLDEKISEIQSFRRYGGVDISEISVETDEISKVLRKPKGKYVTMEAESIRNPAANGEFEMKALAAEIRRFLPKMKTLLVAGIGNAELTADSLGALATDYLLTGSFFGKKLCCISTGACAKTGFDAFEMVASVSAGAKPSAVILIDALAAEDISHVGKTVQITNSGIRPGSGVGADKKEISENTLGLPVLSVGVPTVIRYPHAGENNIFVSPNDIDVTVKRAAKLIALGINLAVFPEFGIDGIKEIVL